MQFKNAFMLVHTQALGDHNTRCLEALASFLFRLAFAFSLFAARALRSFLLLPCKQECTIIRIHSRVRD